MTEIEDSTALLLERLDCAGLDDDVALLILAATIGQKELSEALEGNAVGVVPQHEPRYAPEPPRLFLGEIAVEGFRGIANESRLGLTPGPGITLVVGRNGSGKSSFAEAAELTLTGDSSRWAGRSKIWEEGWACLHHQGPRSITLRLSEDGQAGQTVVRRTWNAGEGLHDAVTTAQRPGEPQEGFESLGLGDAVATWKPFLPYSELGNLVDEGPSKLYDAISSVLGLERWVEVTNVLEDFRKALDAQTKATKIEAQRLSGLLESVDDERAIAARSALPAKGAWDLDTLEALATGAAPPPGQLAALQSLSTLPDIDLTAIGSSTQRLGVALARLDDLAGSDAERASELAGLLEAAVAFHADHHVVDCPVCGTTEMLGEAWAANAKSEVDRLRSQATDVADARKELADAMATASQFQTFAPLVLNESVPGIDMDEARSAWGALLEIETTPGALLASLEGHALRLAVALEEVRSQASEELALRQDEWLPLASQLLAWLPDGRRVQGSAGRSAQLKQAAEWVELEANVVRNERFEPIADTVGELWALLRQSSNVELSDVRLEGKGTRRRVQLDVAVDGIKGAALSVMSQGELHALALSLFLPRATMEQSPFRFIVIDDPVQSMDAARVDGLARTLESVAMHRQIVVFTHDERLPDAFRRLQIDARVLEVTRSPESVVTVRRRTNPVDDYLNDARSMLLTEGMPPLVRRRVVPGLCRNAIEAACLDAARIRLLEAGTSFDEIDIAFEQAHKLKERVALALFGDANKAGEVLGYLNRHFGRSDTDAFRAIDSGAHSLIDDDPEALIGTAARVAKGISGQA